MKKIFTYIFILTALCAMGQDKAAEEVTAISLFKSAPMRVINCFDRNTRIDMLEYYKYGSDRILSNVYGGPCRVTYADSCTVKYMLGNGMTGQMFLIMDNPDSPFIGFIETAETPVPDSTVKIYDRYWRELPFPTPSLKDWLVNGANKKEAETLPFIMYTCVYDPATRTLTMTNTTSQHYLPDDSPAALKLLQPEIKYKWDGKKFKKQK